MDKTKAILIILIIIVAVLAAGMIFSAGFAKTDTKINVMSNNSLTQNDEIKVGLQDESGNLERKTIYFNFIGDDGNVSKYSVDTNVNGKARLNLSGIDEGNYTVNITFEGDDKYNPSSASQKLEIKEVAVEEQSVYEEPATSTSSSSSNSDDGYWETSPDADREYHTEYESDGEFRQYDRSGRLVGSSHDEDQVEVANNVGWRI